MLTMVSDVKMKLLELMVISSPCKDVTETLRGYVTGHDLRWNLQYILDSDPTVNIESTLQENRKMYVPSGLGMRHRQQLQATEEAEGLQKGLSGEQDAPNPEGTKKAEGCIGSAQMLEKHARSCRQSQEAVLVLF